MKLDLPASGIGVGPVAHSPDTGSLVICTTVAAAPVAPGDNRIEWFGAPVGTANVRQT